MKLAPKQKISLFFPLPVQICKNRRTAKYLTGTKIECTACNNLFQFRDTAYSESLGKKLKKTNNYNKPPHWTK